MLLRGHRSEHRNAARPLKSAARGDRFGHEDEGQNGAEIEKSAREVFELVINLNKRLGSSMIMVTHNLELSKKSDRVFELKDGILIEL